MHIQLLDNSESRTSDHIYQDSNCTGNNLA